MQETRIIAKRMGNPLCGITVRLDSLREEKKIDEHGLYRWLEPRMYPPHWAVVLDVIGGDVASQRDCLKRWPFPRALSRPVWHLDKPFDYLAELIEEWPSGICLGSAGPYWQIGSNQWLGRMRDVFEWLDSRYSVWPWLHGLRMLGHISNYRLASADSTNVAQNFGVATGCSHCMARRINSVKRKRGASRASPNAQFDILK